MKKWRITLTQHEHIEAIEKRLWGEADTLRANSNYAGKEYFLNCQMNGEMAVW